MQHVIIGVVEPITGLAITLRPAHSEDGPGLRRLAALDSSAVPVEPLIVAEVDGQIEVAVSMSDLSAIADPFAHTAQIVDLVRAHIRHMAGAPGARRRPLSRLVRALLPQGRERAGGRAGSAPVRAALRL